MITIKKFYQLLKDKPLINGSKLQDRYKVLDVIGSGSYGIVYLCQDSLDNSKKVIKQLRPSKRKMNDEVEHFHREAELLSRLNHKNIPKYFHSFTEQENLFQVMEFIEGKNLEEEIFGFHNTFNEKEGLLVFARLFDILSHLHAQHIYHLDLRIPNILMKGTEPYLIDFGLAKQMDCTYEDQECLKMKQQDYFDLGDILLFLLYTTYSAKSKKALPWTEELNLQRETVHLLKRLLGIMEPYKNEEQVLLDLRCALQVWQT